MQADLVIICSKHCQLFGGDEQEKKKGRTICLDMRFLNVIWSLPSMLLTSVRILNIKMLFLVRSAVHIPWYSVARTWELFMGNTWAQLLSVICVSPTSLASMNTVWGVFEGISLPFYLGLCLQTCYPGICLVPFLTCQCCLPKEAKEAIPSRSCWLQKSGCMVFNCLFVFKQIS